MANNEGTGGRPARDGVPFQWDRLVAGWIGRCRERMMGLATRMMHDADEAEDIVQNASIAALEAVRADPAKADSVRRPGEWLAGIVRKKALQEQRNAALRKRLREENRLAICTYIFPGEDEWQVDRLVQRVVDAAPRELTPRESEVIAMALDGMADDGIAKEMGISPVTVRVHRAAALRKLRAAYRGWAD